MKTSVIESPGHIRIIETSIPKVNDEEVLVKLKGTGLCISNLPVWEGREWFSYPFEPGSPGHEGYGVIEKVGRKVTNLSVGDRVALISYHAYAEYDKTHMSNVVKLTNMPIQSAFPGEPIACAVNIFERCDIRRSDTVTVIGTGYLGCLLIQLIKSTGARVIGVSRRKTSLEYAEQSGADELVQFTDVWETIHNIRMLTPGGTARVIEATGVQEAIDVATDVVAERGRMIIAGYHQDGLRKVNMQQWNWKGLDVINAHEREQAIYVEGLRKAVHYVRLGVLRPEELITHQFEFREINKAFKMMHDKPEGFLKGIITYS
jgi:threonine dehydrogenase-like Zn-dependent dehydrogenase